jgi:hypothetical protein
MTLSELTTSARDWWKKEMFVKEQYVILKEE